MIYVNSTYNAHCLEVSKLRLYWELNVMKLKTLCFWNSCLISRDWWVLICIFLIFVMPTNKENLLDCTFFIWLFILNFSMFSYIVTVMWYISYGYLLLTNVLTEIPQSQYIIGFILGVWRHQHPLSHSNSLLKTKGYLTLILIGMF